MMKILWLTENVWSAMMNLNGNVSVSGPNEEIIQNNLYNLWKTEK